MAMEVMLYYMNAHLHAQIVILVILAQNVLVVKDFIMVNVLIHVLLDIQKKAMYAKNVLKS